MFYCVVTDYHKPFKAIHLFMLDTFIILQFCIILHKTQSQGVSRVEFLSATSRRDCFLACTSSESHPQPLAHGPFPHHQSQHGWIKSFSHCITPAPASALQDLCEYIGPYPDNADNVPILRSAD